jgi:(heptosyl)LPS beta-1,4-glucosyltransferase
MIKDTNKTEPILGVVAISFNEERDLPGFIDHLLPWVDEIVIVDDGSTDRTAEIARTKGAKVKFVASPRKSGEYFSQQRNKGIDVATSTWLLHMDIDERVTPELAEEILKTIRDDSKDAYKYGRLNFFLHRPMKGGGWQNWNLVHLARREVLSFAGMYHEECIVTSPSERIGQIKEKMWHLNDESYKERMEKSILYCQEQARRISARGQKIRWWHLAVLPAAEFMKKYLLSEGYRDGVLGLLWGFHCSCAMFRACAVVWDEQNSFEREKIEQQLREKWRQNSDSL